MSNLIYPKFIIGGAPKCGTSSLYFWLAAHPEMVGSPVKEPFFFADKINKFNKGLNCIEHSLEDYTKHFKNGSEDKLSFESTAHYLYYQNAIDGLQKLPVKPKVIFLLREPSGQLASHYRMEKYRTQRVDMPLAEYMKQDYVLEYTEYAKYLQKWFDQYGHDYVKVVLFEEMMQDKMSTVQDICSFLGVDGSFYNDFDWEHRNKSVKIKSTWLHQFGLKVQAKIPHSIQKLLLPIYMKLNAGSIPKLTRAEKELLIQFKEYKKGEVKKLEHLLPKLDFSLWN